MFYLTMHSTHFIYGYMASDIWLRTILIVRKETCCCHIGYSFRLTARVLLYAPSHRQDSTYHSLCYTSRGALAGMRILHRMYKNCCHHYMGYSFWLAAKDLLYAPFHNRIAHTTTCFIPVVEHWLVTTHIMREEICCRHYTGYSFQLAARVLLYAPSHI